MNSIYETSLPSMPAYRTEAFLRAVAARVREGNAAGVDAQATIALVLREQQALTQALADPIFQNAMANAYVAEMKLQAPNTLYATDVEQAATQTNGILNNRIRDAKNFQALLVNADFLARVAVEAAQPAPAAKPYELPPIKQEEIIRRLVQPNDPDGAEPRVHVAAAALGHQVVHQVLANIFRPKAGGLTPILAVALDKAWPEATPEQRDKLATSWLKARHDPAHSIADGLKPGGPMYVEAMRRADMARNETPQPIVRTPAINAGMMLPTLAPAFAAPAAMNSEAQKTRDERAADIAYTINHAISCLTTDVFIAPSISAAFSGSQGQKLNWKLYRHEAAHYFQGEVIGDFAAVPLTVLVQRLFPNFMDGMSKFLEPFAAPFFRSGAKNAAEHWGKKHGLAADNVEVVDRAQAIYNHEIKHLPQAAMWNVFAFPIGVFGQYFLEKEHDHGHEHGGGKNIWKIIGFKALGALISNGMLLGGRALSPDVAEKIDRFNSRTFIKPTTRVVGKLFGVNDDDIDRMEKREATLDSAPKAWAERVATEQQQAPAQQAGAALG